MRLFISIPLSPEMRRGITETMDQLKKAGVRGRYIPVENLHITLAFIGEMPDAGPIKKALEDVKIEPFEMKLSGMGTFGNLLWIGLEKEPKLEQLSSRVRLALDEAKIPFDRKKFSAHITIVREMSGNWRRTQVPASSMAPDHISLMRSDRIAGRMKYTEIYRKTIER